MHGPTYAELTQMLADLRTLPDDDPEKAPAIAKVEKQLNSLSVSSDDK